MRRQNRLKEAQKQIEGQISDCYNQKSWLDHRIDGLRAASLIIDKHLLELEQIKKKRRVKP